MTLINNHVYPLDLAENWPVLDDELVGCEQNLELAPTNLLLVLFT